MPHAKRRVKKGTKSKGYRKTGRTRRVKNTKTLSNKQYKKRHDWIAIMHPPKGHRTPYPDKYYTTFDMVYNFSCPVGAIGVSTGGNYFNWSAVSGYRPNVGASCTYVNSLSYSATGATAGTGGMGGVAVSPSTATDQVPNMNAFNAIYQNYIIYQQRISVDVDIQSIYDSNTVTIVPLVTNTAGAPLTIPIIANSLYAASAKGSRTRTMKAYGQSGLKNMCVNSVTVQELAGRPGSSLEEIISTNLYNAALPLAAYPTNNVGWLISVQDGTGDATSGIMNFRIHTVSKVLLYNAFPTVTY